MLKKWKFMRKLDECKMYNNGKKIYNDIGTQMIQKWECWVRMKWGMGVIHELAQIRLL